MLLKLSFFIYKIRATHFPKLLQYTTTPEEFILVVCTELDVYKNIQSRSYLRGTGNMATLSTEHALCQDTDRKQSWFVKFSYTRSHQLTQLEAGLGYYFLLYQKSIYISFLTVGLLSSQLR